MKINAKEAESYLKDVTNGHSFRCPVCNQDEWCVPGCHDTETDSGYYPVRCANCGHIEFFDPDVFEGRFNGEAKQGLVDKLANLFR